MSLCNCMYVYDPEYPCKVHPERKDYVQALERLARAAVAKEKAADVFGLEDAGRALWLDAYAEFKAALEEVRKLV